MHAPQMLSVCCRYARNRNDAEEIFQQGFYLVYKNIGQLNDYKAVSGWIKRIFVNTALQYNKQNQDLYPLRDIQNDIRFIASGNNALSNLETEELTKLIQALPMRSREVFNLYVIEGNTHKEIAEMMGISIGTSKSQLHDARLMLQKAIISNNNKTDLKLG